MKTQTTSDLERAREQASAQFQSIHNLITRLRSAEAEGDDDAREAVEREIQEDPLSIRIRDGWRNIGEPGDGAEEFEILLCTGGPACRIVGTIGDHDEPATARLEYQDWFTPWTAWEGTADVEDTLLAYCRCFYFGEG